MIWYVSCTYTLGAYHSNSYHKIIGYNRCGFFCWRDCQTQCVSRCLNGRTSFSQQRSIHGIDDETFQICGWRNVKYHTSCPSCPPQEKQISNVSKNKFALGIAMDGNQIRCLQRPVKAAGPCKYDITVHQKKRLWIWRARVSSQLHDFFFVDCGIVYLIGSGWF